MGKGDGGSNRRSVSWLEWGAAPARRLCSACDPKAGFAWLALGPGPWAWPRKHTLLHDLRLRRAFIRHQLPCQSQPCLEERRKALRAAPHIEAARQVHQEAAPGVRVRRGQWEGAQPRSGRGGARSRPQRVPTPRAVAAAVLRSLNCVPGGCRGWVRGGPASPGVQAAPVRVRAARRRRDGARHKVQWGLRRVGSDAVHAHAARRLAAALLGCRGGRKGAGAWP
jgi:hypothetical protein